MISQTSNFMTQGYDCPPSCPQYAYSRGKPPRTDADFLEGPTEYLAPQCEGNLSPEDRVLCENAGIDTRLLRELRALACRSGVERLILFGSRARGDYRRASDIDLAALGGSVSLFALDCDELTFTPLRYDVVNLGTLKNKDLLAEIEKDGARLYERN